MTTEAPSESRPVLLVVGAGPGVSGSLARAYAVDGFDVGLVGLGTQALEELQQQLRDDGAEARWVEADVTDEAGLRAAVTRLADAFGHVEVLHYNPSAYREADPLTLTPQQLHEDMALGVSALLVAVQAARPYLTRGARITATGSMAADQPSPGVASLGVQKAALRNLVHSIDQHLAPEGIRAVSVTVHGMLSRDSDSPFHPDRVAATLLAAGRQLPDLWRSEVRHPHLTAG